MPTRIFAITSNTFVETIRQPVFGVVVMTTLLLMILNVGLAAFTLDDDNKLLAELGLSTLLLSSLFLASFSATSVLTREIDNKTVVTVVSKPVNRPVFLLGKFLGLVLALALGFYICFLGFFYSMQHEVLQTSSDPWHYPVLIFGFGGLLIAVMVAGIRNFLSGREFITSALWLGTPLLTAGALLTCIFGREWEIQSLAESLPDPRYFLAAGLVFCAVILLAAIALAASTRLGQVMTLLVCVGFLALGLVLDYLLSEWARQSTLAAIVYRHLPNFSPFWITDAVNAELTIPLSYVAYSITYSLLLTGAALLVAVALFQRREVG